MLHKDEIAPSIDTRTPLSIFLSSSSEDDRACLKSNSGTTLAITSYVMSWTLLFLAALFEIIWAVGLKSTDGFTRPWPTLGVAAALVISFALLGLAAKSLPIGTAYAVWTGIGVVGTAAFGILILEEPATTKRLISIGLILAGAIGLKLS
jgi:quaternary ammonium compound-resistance protein SugE